MKQKDFAVHANFTKIPNAILKDKRISFRAKGIYCMMVQYFLIPGFVIYKSMLMAEGNEGAAAFNLAWNELKEYGYLKMERHHRNGRFEYEYELFETPELVEVSLQSETQAPPFTGELSADRLTEGAEEAETFKQEISAGQQQATLSSHQSVSLRSTAGFPQEGSRAVTFKEETAQEAVELPPYQSNQRFAGFSQGESRAYKERIEDHYYPAAGIAIPCYAMDRTTISEIKSQIEYDCLVEMEGKDFSDEVVRIMEDVLNTPDGMTLKVGGKQVIAAIVKERFRQLDYYAVQAVLLHFRENALPIRNPYAYMLTALYNEPAVHHFATHNETTYLLAESW